MHFCLSTASPEWYQVLYTVLLCTYFKVFLVYLVISFCPEYHVLKFFFFDWDRFSWALLNLLQHCFCFCVLIFWLRGSPPARDWTHTAALEEKSYPWTARGVPRLLFQTVLFTLRMPVNFPNYVRFWVLILLHFVRKHDCDLFRGTEAVPFLP